MASPPEIQKLLDKLETAYKKLGEANPFKNFNASSFNDINDAISILNNGLTSVDEKLSYLNDDLSKISAGFKNIVDSIKTQNQSLNLTSRAFNNLSSLTQKLKNDQTGISELNKKDLENLKKKAYEERANLTTAKNILKTKEKLNKKEQDALNEINAVLQGQEGLFRSLIANANKRISQEEKINKLMGLGGAAVEGTQKALNKMGFGGLSNALGLDEVKKKMRETAEEIEKSDGNANSFSNKFKVLKVGIKEAGQQLITSLKDPLVVVGFLVDQLFDALKKADEQTGQLAKAFGTSYSEALSLRSELNTIASLSGDVNMTTEALQESLIAVNKEFGTATMLSGELLTDFTNMTKVMGYTDEAAAKLSKITAATGTDLSDNTAQILGTAAAFNVTNKLALNEKEIVEDVAKASAATTVSLGMQPGKIAAAVVQAKALGLELEQVEGIAESLLNFESSISNELEAELLTGRSLNLEQARYLALTNDIEGVGKEIAKQGITAAEFGGMNVIQQKSIAESVGLTREELAQSLIKQQALTKLGGKDKTLIEAYNRLKKEGLSDAKIQEKLGKDIQADQLKSQSIQERFNASVEKLKEIFITLTEPLLAGLNKVMNVITKIVASFEKIKGVVKSLIGDKASSALGSLASVATIGSLTYALGKFLLSSITRGTEMNPTVVKLQGGIPGAGGGLGDSDGGLMDMFGGGSKKGGGFGRIKRAFKGGGFKGAGKAVGRMVKGSGALTKLGKGSGYLSLLSAGMDLAGNLTDENRSIGNALGKTLDQNKFTASGGALGAGIGALFGGVGAVPGALIGSGIGGLLDFALGDKTQIVKDGIAPSSKGPFTIMDSYGATAITSAGDNLAVSPNLSPSISVNIAPLVNEMQAVKAVLVQMLNKDSNVYLDGAKVGRGISMASSKIG
jgi:hypothetical protein